MKKNLIILAVIFLLATPVFAKSTTKYQAEEKISLPEEVIIKTTWAEAELLALAKEYATKAGVSTSLMTKIVICETPWKRDKDYKRYYDKTDAQSRLTYNAGQISRHPNWGKVGDREDSWGPSQFHRPGKSDGWPAYSREDVVDPDFIFPIMADLIKQGKAYLWTCSGSKMPQG